MQRYLVFPVLLFFIFAQCNVHAQNGIITTIAGLPDTAGYSGDGGLAIDAELNLPQGISVDRYGNLYISDTEDGLIRKVNSSGIINVIAGNKTFGWGYSGNGGQATNAELYFPTATIIDHLGNIFIADSYNNVIRQVDTNGIITTIAGNGYEAGMGWGAYSGDGGQATDAEFYAPVCIAQDNSNNIYIADCDNGRIRKINTAGIIMTVAGGGSGGDSGQATNASLLLPNGIAIDYFGNIFIAESGHEVIRKVNTSGIITTIAGIRFAGYSGDGGQATNAELYDPGSVALDSLGNLYISDCINQVIRKVNTLGIINTVVGNGYKFWMNRTYNGGYSGDGGQATNAELSHPCGITLDRFDNIYVADDDNQIIRTVNNVTGIAELKQFDRISVFPNPNNGNFVLSLVNSNEKYSLEIYNILGAKILAKDLPQRQNYNINLAGQPNGIYLYRVLKEDEGLVGSGKVIIAH